MADAEAARAYAASLEMTFMKRAVRRLLLSGASAAVIGSFALGNLALAEDGNQLINGSFDTDTDNWGPPGLWNERDSRGSATSGSGVSINSSPNASGTVEFDLEQCVPVQPSGRYRLSADAFVPAGQPRSPYPALAVFWFTQPGCPGMGQPSGPPAQFQGFASNVWGPVTTHVNVPANMSYARVMLGAGRVAGEQVTPFAVVHFDNVWFSRVDHLTSRAFLPLLSSE
jgi:hypothetical protein